MTHADVIVIGGGSAGSLATAMLGRAGISTMLVDTHQSYPEDFRCEKIHDDQAELLLKTGVGEPVLAAATPIHEMWVARLGRVVDKARRAGKPYEYGIAYDDLVNVIRRQIPEHVPFICGKATAITTGPQTQRVVLSNGETWTSRLIVLATGLNNNLVRDKIVRQVFSKGHSVSVGFDIARLNECPALTYFADRNGIGYITIFPIGSRMRVNLFVYRDHRDRLFRQLRESPIATILSELPRLRRYLDQTVRVTSDVRIRPIDLYDASFAPQRGIVMIGDTFATSCPAAGTGLNKVATDVERLCNHHIPRWLDTPDMEIGNILQYYNDPVKTRCDQWSEHEAYYWRNMAVQQSFPWRVRRAGWFAYHLIQYHSPWRLPFSDHQHV